MGVIRMTMKSSQYWFTLFLTVGMLIIPIMAIRFYFVDVHPSLSDRVRLKQRVSRLRSRSSETMLRTPSTRRSRRSLRSGYAFAHQEGFGRLITSGKIMGKRKQQSTPSHSNSHAADMNFTGEGKHVKIMLPSTVEV